MLIVFVSYFGNQVHRPRLIGLGGLLMAVSATVLTLPHFLSRPYEYDSVLDSKRKAPWEQTLLLALAHVNIQTWCQIASSEVPRSCHRSPSPCLRPPSPFQPPWSSSARRLTCVVPHSDADQRDLCHWHGNRSEPSCSQNETRHLAENQNLWLLMATAQLLFGVGSVPIQPFGLSYIDDFAEPGNSALYIGEL